MCVEMYVQIWVSDVCHDCFAMWREAKANARPMLQETLFIRATMLVKGGRCLGLGGVMRGK